MRCAACKFLRRRCDPAKCILAPYFVADEAEKFETVHRIYGASNVGKMLQEVPVEFRAAAAESLYFEAQTRQRNPVYGSAGIITMLHRELDKANSELAKAQAEIATLEAQRQFDQQQKLKQVEFVSVTPLGPAQQLGMPQFHHQQQLQPVEILSFKALAPEQYKVPQFDQQLQVEPPPGFGTLAPSPFGVPQFDQQLQVETPPGFENNISVDQNGVLSQNGVAQLQPVEMVSSNAQAPSQYGGSQFDQQLQVESLSCSENNVLLDQNGAAQWLFSGPSVSTRFY